jgi:hypothetical protein
MDVRFRGKIGHAADITGTGTTMFRVRFSARTAPVKAWTGAEQVRRICVVLNGAEADVGYMRLAF